MEIVIKPNVESACTLAARIIEKTVKNRPNSVLGLATGATMEPLYRELARLHSKEDLDLHSVTTFNLDEYVDAVPTSTTSYRYFLTEKFLNHVNIPESQTKFHDATAKDMEASCAKFEKAIKDAGGIDIQLLGIGRAGHIGFNEPTSALTSRTRIKTLTSESVRISRGWFPPEQPIGRQVVTMGVGTILEARCILLLAFGKDKATAIAKAVEGPLTAMVPASALQLHPKAIVIVDELAASDLRLAEYYRYVYDNKPEWQRYEN